MPEEKKAESLTAHDSTIREPLFDFLEEKYGKIRILEEQAAGSARADVVMVTPDALYGIEIKSNDDTYNRLARQVKGYDQCFDYNIIAVGSTHAMHVADHVPDWWGIISIEEIDDRPDFYIIREPGKNPNVVPKEKISILWRPELAHIQEKNNLPSYKGKSKDYVRAVILDRVPEDILWKQVSEELFERDYTTIRKEIENYRRSN